MPGRLFFAGPAFFLPARLFFLPARLFFTGPAFFRGAGFPFAGPAFFCRAGFFWPGRLLPDRLAQTGPVVKSRAHPAFGRLSLHFARLWLRAPEDFLERRYNLLDMSAMRVA